MNIDRIINIIREQRILKEFGLPPGVPGLSGGGGGTNAITSQAKARTIRSMLTDPTGKKAARKFANDPQTKLDEMMGAGAAGAPTNNVGDGKIAGTVEAGDDPPVRKKPWNKGRKYLKGPGRKTWM